MTYDAAVVGLGAMGSMAAWQLARRGLRVIGFDRFTPPHGLGSSGGLSRIIREAYAEQPFYVPLVRRAFELWEELGREGGRQLLLTTGGLMVGERDSAIAGGAIRSAARYGVPCEILTPEQVARRFPAFRLPPSQVALYERRAGALAPELAIATALARAASLGAELRFGESVLGWEAGARIRLRTQAGEVAADRLVLAAGAWMATGLPRLDVPLRVSRQVLFWFEPRGDRSRFQPDRFPVFLWQWTRGHSIYGFPDQGQGFKVAIHHEGPAVHPDQVDRQVAPGEERELVEIVERCFPGGTGPVLRSGVCLYTTTRDEDFVLDRHPADARVAVASPCSGHGFKFAPAIGEILADLVTSGATRHDLTPFRIDRPGLRGPRRDTDAHG